MKPDLRMSFIILFFKKAKSFDIFIGDFVSFRGASPNETHAASEWLKYVKDNFDKSHMSI